MISTSACNLNGVNPYDNPISCRIPYNSNTADCFVDVDEPCIPADNFRMNPEFQIRFNPPSPYPPKTPYFKRSSYNKPDERCPVENEQSECICEEIPIPEWSSQFCLQRITTILSRPELEQMGQRVLAIWAIYLRKSPNGLFIGDSDVMACIVLQLSNKFAQLHYSNEFMELLINHLNKGIYIKRNGDAFESKRLSYSLNILGQAICPGHPLVQQKVLKFLIVWSNQAAKRETCCANIKEPKKCQHLIKEKVKTKLLPGEVFWGAVEFSRLPRMLGDYVKDGTYTNSYCDVLHLLRRFCESSAIIRCRILKIRLLDPLLLKLCLEDCTNKILGRTIELIYSCFGHPVEMANKIKKTHCPHQGTFQILLARFFKQITQFTSKLHLNLRNDTAFLICLLLKNIRPLRAKFGKYLSGVASLISNNVLGIKCIQIPYIIDSTPEDAELLKYLIWMLQMVIDTVPSAMVIQDYKIVESLIRILIGPSKLITLISNITSVESLQTIAWSTLTSIAKQEPATLLVKDGIPVIMNYLKLYASNGEKDQRTLSMFTHILRTILSMDEEKLINDKIISFFNKEEAQTVFVNAISRLTKTNFSTAEETTLSNLLLCCASMGQYDIKEKEAFADNKGVWLLVRVIRQVLYHPAHERHMDPVLHIAIAECALRCIADSPACLEVFLGYEGLLRILDLLEISAGPPASLHILNCILELCEYPRCMDQVFYWRRPMRNITQRLAYGDGFKMPDTRIPGAIKPMFGEALGDVTGDQDHTLSAMLSELWREEEKRLGVLRDRDGCIGDIDKPLMSQFGREYSSRPGKKIRKPSNYPGPSCLDMMGSVRPKIFLLVKKITEAVNTEAQLFDGLGLPNQITMQIMINFLDLKRGEIWIELMGELKDEQFPLVDTDEKAMDLLVKISKNKVAAVIETQRYLIRRSTEKDEIHERELYSSIHKCHLQNHLEAVREAQHRAKTTSYAYLVERRLWQKSQLQNAIVKSCPNCRVHRTTDGPLNITVWPFRIKAVQSEPPIERVMGDIIPEIFEEIKVDKEKRLSAFPSLDYIEGSRLSVASSPNLTKRESGEVDDHRSLNVSLVTGYNAGTSPTSAEGGFYQISPDILRKAMLQVLAKEKKQGWINKGDDENYWKIRAKWRKDWYPEEQLRLTKFKAASDAWL